MVPGWPEARPDAASLRKVLGYNLQQRNVISRALKNSFPGLWPDGALPEASFYEALYRLMESPESCRKIHDDLLGLGMRKGNNWVDALCLPARIVHQARPLVSEPAAVDAALALDDADDVALALTRLCQQLTREGHPEFAWWSFWVGSTLSAKMEGASGTNSERGLAKPEALKVDPNMLEDEWRAALLEVGRSATEAAEVSPSANLVGWFEAAIQRLADMARRYEELTNQSGALQRFDEALDELEMMGVPGVTDLTSRARKVMARAVLPGQMLNGWAERLRMTGKALREVYAREAEHKAAIESALSKGDYAEIPLHSQQAASAQAELDTLRTDLAALVAELQTPGHEQGEGSDLTALAPAPREVCKKLEYFEEVGPVAPTEALQESADTHRGTAVALEMGRETFIRGYDGTPGLVDCQVSHQTERVSPDLTTSMHPEASAKPESGSKIASLPERDDPHGPSQSKGEAACGAELPQWSAQVLAHEVAGNMLTCGAAQQAQTAMALAWALVRDGRIPLAYHIARVAAEVLPPKPEVIRPEPLRAIHLGGYLTSSAGGEVVEIGETLRQFYEVDMAGGALRGQWPLILMTYAAVLRPALVAPHTSGAEGLLRGLPLDESLSVLHSLREQILDPSFRYQAILHLGPGTWELFGRAAWANTGVVGNQPATQLQVRTSHLGLALLAREGADTRLRPRHHC